MSFTSLLLCFAMLAGSTFAWFTDTATTGVNKIVAGKLKVDIVDANGQDSLTGTGSKLLWTQKQSSEGQATAVTDADKPLWEPGVTFLTQGFKIANKGNLALKWKAQVNKGTTAANEGDYDLLDVIDFYLVKDEINEAGTPLDEFTGTLEAKKTSENVYYIKGVMKKEAGNNYQGLTLDGITITVYATQDTVENDSFNNQYDKDAAYPVVDADALAATLPTLADNAVITVNGTVSEALTISKPVTIHNLTATAPVTIASNGVTLNAAKIEYKAAKTPALVVNSGVTDVAITNSAITAATGSQDNHTAVSLPVSGKVVFTGNTVTNDYNGIEFGQGAAEFLGNGSVIANNTFKNIGNNAISIYRVAEGATVTIENNVFEKVSNAIRLSNYVESTNATFEIKKNTVDIVNSWEKIFVLLEDVGNNDFVKYTLNFSGNTFNGETVNYYKVYSDAARDFVTNNNPATTGTN